MRARGVWLAVALGATTALAATIGGPLVATPNVGVVELAEGASGTASVTLANTSSTTQSVAAVVQDTADCDDMTMTAAPQSFALASGSMRAVSVACQPSSSAGMRRCLYHVADSSGSDLATFLGVCEAGTTSSLSPNMTAVTFPTVAVGSSATMTVTLANTGSNGSATGTLHLQLTDLGGNFLLGAPCNPNVNGCDLPGAPLGSASIDVVCAPSAVATFNAALYVVDSLGDRLTAPVQLTCTGSPASGPSIHVTTTPSPLDLRTVAVLGGSGSGNVHVQNVGTTTLTLTGIPTISGGGDWSFTVGSKCPSFPCGLAPQDAVDIAVHFSPSAIGERDATMVITSNDPASSQIVVQLAGIGGGATLALAPGEGSAVDLGDVAKSGSAAIPIELINSGDQTLTGVSLALVGAPQLTISPATMVDVPPGAVPTPVMLTCTPGGSTGTFTTTFTATGSNTVGNSTATVTATCHGTDSPLLAAPPSLALGALRTGTGPGPFSITLKNAGASALTLTGVPTTSPASSILTVTGPSQLTIPAMGSAQAMVAIDDSADATIATSIIASDNNGDTVTIPVTGSLTTATVSVPAMQLLGTFCVNAPTTPTTITLTATGTATIELPTAPTMATPSSPFSVAAQTPLVFPASVPPASSAVVNVTPDRQRTAMTVSDTVQWMTDIAGLPPPTTAVAATFLGSGAAIAPASIAFGPEPPHVFVDDSQSVMLQNCSLSTITLVPSIDPPFSIDPGTVVPTSLSSGATASVNVSFHPTRPGMFSGTLTIATSATTTPLTVALTGIGMSTTPIPDAGSGSGPGPGQTSFYACSCSSHDPRGGLPIAAAILATLVPRRRRRRA